MWRLAKLTTISICTFALLIIFVMGKRSPAKPDFLGVDQCTPQPCWRGIYPGKTSLGKALRIVASTTNLQLKHYGSFGGHYACWRETTDATDTICYDADYGQLMFAPIKNPLTLGDAINLYGTPISATTCQNFKFNPPNLYQVETGFIAVFSNGVIVQVYESTDSELRVNPYSLIHYIILATTDNDYIEGSISWTGFKSYTDYEGVMHNYDSVSCYRFDGEN